MNLMMLKRSLDALANRKPEDLIGKVVISRYPYYNSEKGEINFKARPMLVIGREKYTFPCDLITLPLSRVTIKQNLHSTFDIRLDDKECNTLNLNSMTSFVRVHKQTVVHSKDVSSNVVADLKGLLPQKYMFIKEAHNSFIKELF